MKAEDGLCSLHRGRKRLKPRADFPGWRSYNWFYCIFVASIIRTVCGSVDMCKIYFLMCLFCVLMSLCHFVILYILVCYLFCWFTLVYQLLNCVCFHGAVSVCVRAPAGVCSVCQQHYKYIILQSEPELLLWICKPWIGCHNPVTQRIYCVFMDKHVSLVCLFFFFLFVCFCFLKALIFKYFIAMDFKSNPHLGLLVSVQWWYGSCCSV